MLQERSFDTGTVIINFAEGPSFGPPLVLLSGFTGRWQQFLPIIPALSERWQVYALDYRGHGKSGRVPGHYRAIDYFADLRAFMLHKIAEPAALLGHSMGGSLALSLAEALPEKARGVIVGDGSLDLDYHIQVMSTKATQDFFTAKRELAGRPVQELVSILEEGGSAVEEAETLSQLDPEVMAFHTEGRLRAFFKDVHSVDLRRLTCPLLLLQGNAALGGLLSDREVEHALAVHDNTSHVFIEHAGHDLGFWQGDLSLFLDAVTQFLDSL